MLQEVTRGMPALGQIPDRVVHTKLIQHVRRVVLNFQTRAVAPRVVVVHNQDGRLADRYQQCVASNRASGPVRQNHLCNVPTGIRANPEAQRGL